MSYHSSPLHTIKESPRLADGGALSHASSATSKHAIVNSVKAAALDDQGHRSPNLEGDCRTTRSQIGHADRNLNALVNQRLAIMSHPQSIQTGNEVASTSIVAIEVAVSNHSQPTNASIDKASEVETRGEPIAIIEVDNAKTSKLLDNLFPRIGDFERILRRNFK